MMKRINITIDEGLLYEIDSYAKKLHGSRSGLISLVLTLYLDYVDNTLNSSFYPSKPINGRPEV